MENKEILELLIAKKLGGGITDAEALELEQMLSNDPEAQQIYLEFQNIWNASRQQQPPHQLAAEERWNGLQKKMATSQAPRVTPRRVWLRYAAAVALLVVLFAVFRYNVNSDVVTVSTGNGIKNVMLPDGSTVTLNAASQIQYDGSTFTDTRKVWLRGEAFFSVRKNGGDFEVESSNASITVLGTTFNVEAVDQKTTVSCLTGRVKVDNKNHDRQVVISGGSAVLVQGDILSGVYPVDKAVALSWLSSELDFRNRPLKEVFDVLGHYYDRRFILRKDMNNLTFTGNFEDSSLESALQTISISAGLKVTVTRDSSIIID